MTAWGVVAVCGIGGAVAGPFLDAAARRVRRVERVDAAAVDAAAVDAATVGADLVDDEASTLANPVVAERSTGHGAAAATSGTGERASYLEAVAAATVMALACALAAARLGAVPQLAAFCLLAGALVLVSVTDLRTGLVPRRIVYVASVAVGAGLLAASAANGTWRPMLDALIGAAVAFGVFAAVWWVVPKAMGFGDVRLAGLCGGALGWLGFAPFYLGFVSAFVTGALMGVVVLLAAGRRRFPFAPALAFGTMFGVLWGAWLGQLVGIR